MIKIIALGDRAGKSAFHRGKFICMFMFIFKSDEACYTSDSVSFMHARVISATALKKKFFFKRPGHSYKIKVQCQFELVGTDDYSPEVRVNSK